jgi:hypothetical protein
LNIIKNKSQATYEGGGVRGGRVGGEASEAVRMLEEFVVKIPRDFQ